MHFNLKRLQNLQHTQLGKIFKVLNFCRGYSLIPPSFILLLLTYKCNLNCAFCYQASEKKEVIPDMSLENIFTIENNIRTSFNLKPRIHFTGGEPTVNKDFLKILKYFCDKDYKTSLTTNGEIFVKPELDFKYMEGLIEINLSLNTVFFDKYLFILKLFERNFKRKKYVTLSCPINEKNQFSFVEIIKRFENSYASCITFQHPIFTGSCNIAFDVERIKKQIDEIKQTKFRIPILFFPDIKTEDYYREFYNKNRCSMPWFVLSIQPNANIVPCDSLNIKIGNAKEESLKNIWNNKKFREFRRLMQSQGLSYPVCRRCCHKLF